MISLEDLEGDQQRESLLQDENQKKNPQADKPRWMNLMMVAASIAAFVCGLFIVLRGIVGPRLEQEIQVQDLSGTILSSNIDIDLADELTILRLADEMNSDGYENPIPPIHPHHSGRVRYSSSMNSAGKVQYRRDINAPCNFGMLLFTVGLAKDDMPYTYEVYGDAYLFSDNKGLCLFYPSYNGYQVADRPFWNAMDPTSIEIKPLDARKMHWISSRVVNPYHSKKKFNPKLTGDYIVIAKGDFYTPHYYQALKDTINHW
jgi:hypothetical protein